MLCIHSAHSVQVVTDEQTLLSLGINVSDSKEQKLRESIVYHDLRGKKEQVIIRNIRHIGNEIAAISSQVQFHCSHIPLQFITFASGLQ